MNRFSYTTISLVLLLFAHISGFSQLKFRGLPFIRNFTTLDYNAGIQNWSIAQDKRGIMYFANNFGLLEFDGNRWETYRVKNGSKMRSVAIDESGRIYVGCQGDFGYFFPDELGKLKYTSLADSLPPEFRNFDETWNLFLDEEYTYFCTFSHIFKFTRDKPVAVIQPEGPLELSFFANRDLFVNERYRGLSLLKDNQLTLVRGGDFFSNRFISAVLPAYDNQYIISTFQHGVFVLAADGTVRSWNENQQPVFKEAIINSMIRLRNGNYAVGTQNFGLLILNEQGETVLQLTSGKGLENRTVLSLLEDDMQNLWVGHNNGLAYVELGSPFTFINEQSGLPGTGYSAYLDDDYLYLGTNTGLYRRAVKPESSFELIEGSRGQVYNIGKYGHELLMGHHNGAFRVESNKAIALSNEPGAWIFLPLRNSPGKLVGGVYAGIQFFNQRNTWRFSSKPEGFKESSRIMEQDRDGYLWITHGYKGVFRLSLDTEAEKIKEVSFYGAEKGFPSNLLINVFSIRNELIFTSERGVYKYDKRSDRFVLEPLFTNLLGANTQLWGVREDALGNIYFIGREQMGVIRKNSGGRYEVDLNSFNKIRRYLNDDLENMVILKNNEVLFGAKEGFIHYDPAIKVPRTVQMQTHIRRFSITSNGDSVLFFGNYGQSGKINSRQNEASKITLPYRLNSVNFTYAATSYESDGEVTYQYYLQKFDKNWSEWTPQSQKEYTNLREGNYTFHVRAKNVFGEISEPATFQFVITPPWYRTTWAYSGYGLLVFGFLVTAYSLLDRKYKHERRMMVLKQKKELIRKDNEMETLAQKNLEEITRLQNEKLEAELRHMNKELGTSTVLILTKNEFISKVKDTLKSLAGKSADETVSKELSKVVHDIEGNLSSDSDWEHFQVHFDKVHGDFSRRFRTQYSFLSPQEMRLSAYLRMNLSTKEIAHLLNISVRGVEISRYRLRKKLKLDRSLNLQEFILNF